MPEARTTNGNRPPNTRSRISNGKDLFLEGVDGRSALVRRYRDILAQLTSDMGGRSK